MLHTLTPWLGTLLLIGVVLTGASHVHAQTNPADAPQDEDEARMHFRLGAAYHESGRFAEAAAEFELAYRLSGRPALLHNMFVAYRDAGNLPGAIRSLREYLRLNPEAEDRAQLTRRLANLENMAEQQGLDVEPPDTDTSPPAAVTATVTVSSPRVASEGGGGGTWTPGWIIAGVGVAAVLGGAIMGGLALGEHSTLDTLCDADHACDPGFEEARDRAGLYAGLADALLISGGVIAATGLILALVITDGGEGQPAASVACTDTGCMAFARGQF